MKARFRLAMPPLLPTPFRCRISPVPTPALAPLPSSREGLGEGLFFTRGGSSKIYTRV